MSLRHMILGLLAINDMSGYDIKRALDTSISFVWTASDSQIYRELRLLEESGAVTSRRVEQTSRPAKNVYTLAPAGRQDLNEWLLSELPTTYINDPFRVRLFFIGLTDPQGQEHLLESRKKQLEREIERWESRQTTFAEVSKSRHPKVLTWQLELLSLTLEQDRIELAWLTKHLDALHSCAKSGKRGSSTS